MYIDSEMNVIDPGEWEYLKVSGLNLKTPVDFSTGFFRSISEIYRFYKGDDIEDLSISLEDVSCIYLVLHIIKAGVISVRDDRLAFLFEFVQIIYNQGTEEGVSVL